MIPDYHIHTFLCKHADGNAEEYLQSAVIKGINEICFTDHAPAPDDYDPRHRMTIAQFPEYRESIKALKPENMEVLFGIEADYYNGCEKFLEEWLTDQGFDLVIGSIHYIKNWGFDNPAERKVWDSVEINSTWKEYFDLVYRLAETRLFDVVGHLDLPKKFGFIPTEKDLPEIIEPAIDKIAEAGMVIELNTSGLRKPVKEIYPSLAILEIAEKKGIPICFGSDAHTPGDICAEFDQALELARRAGYKTYTQFRKRQKIQIPLPIR